MKLRILNDKTARYMVDVMYKFFLPLHAQNNSKEMGENYFPPDKIYLGDVVIRSLDEPVTMSCTSVEFRYTLDGKSCLSSIWFDRLKHYNGIQIFADFNPKDFIFFEDNKNNSERMSERMKVFDISIGVDELTGAAFPVDEFYLFEDVLQNFDVKTEPLTEYVEGDSNTDAYLERRWRAFESHLKHQPEFAEYMEWWSYLYAKKRRIIQVSEKSQDNETSKS